jgi:hypothetical protein
VVDGTVVVATLAGEAAGLPAPLQPARTSIEVATGMASIATGRFLIWLPTLIVLDLIVLDLIVLNLTVVRNGVAI